MSTQVHGGFFEVDAESSEPGDGVVENGDNAEGGVRDDDRPKAQVDAHD